MNWRILDLRLAPTPQPNRHKKRPPVDVIDLCSKNSKALLTPVAIDDLITSAWRGNRVAGQEPRVHKLASWLGVGMCERICARHEAGEPASLLADEHGVSRNAVLNLVRACYVVVRGKAMSVEQIQSAIRMQESGLPITSVQEAVGASYSAVRRALMQVGVQMSRQGFQSINREIG